MSPASLPAIKRRFVNFSGAGKLTSLSPAPPRPSRRKEGPPADARRRHSAGAARVAVLRPPCKRASMTPGRRLRGRRLAGSIEREAARPRPPFPRGDVGILSLAPDARPSSQQPWLQQEAARPPFTHAIFHKIAELALAGRRSIYGHVSW